MDIGTILLGLIGLLVFFGFRKLKSITKDRPWIFWLAICFVSFLFLFGVNELFRRVIGGFAGSYPFVEYWDIQASEGEVIDAIKELNKIDASFQPPSNIEFISKRDTGYNWNSYEMTEYVKKHNIDTLTPLPEKSYENTFNDYWLYVNLYYPDTKEIVHTWTRPNSDISVTTFAFVSLSKIDNPTDTRLINRDYWYIANKRQINKFKETFVDKIVEQIDKKKNGR